MRDLSTEPSPEKDFQLNLYVDGASKGNPGMAGKILTCLNWNDIFE
jgi:hypothetical protein